MKIYIPLSNIYKTKNKRDEYTTLQSLQEQMLDILTYYPYDQLEYTMNEYMQDERKEATELTLKALPSTLPHLTRSHLEDNPYKTHINDAFIRSIEASWSDSYMTEWTQAFKDKAIDNLDKTLYGKLELNYSKIELYTEQSEYTKENTTPIKSLAHLQGTDYPTELYEATHIVIITNKREAVRIINQYDIYEDVTVKDTLYNIAHYLRDIIVDELSTEYVDTENIDRYATMGDFNHWRDMFTDCYMYDAIELIEQDAKRKAMEQNATTALYDATRTSILFDNVAKHYDGDSEPLQITHDGNVFDVHVNFHQ